MKRDKRPLDASRHVVTITRSRGKLRRLSRPILQHSNSEALEQTENVSHDQNPPAGINSGPPFLPTHLQLEVGHTDLTDLFRYRRNPRHTPLRCPHVDGPPRNDLPLNPRTMTNSRTMALTPEVEMITLNEVLAIRRPRDRREGKLEMQRKKAMWIWPQVRNLNQR